MKRITPEMIAGVRRLLEERPLGGLRPVEIPRATLDALAEALFDLAELQKEAEALTNALHEEIEICDDCRTLATRRFRWASFCTETLCEQCAQATKDSPRLLTEEELAVAAPLRALRALFGGAS